ncbi:MAG: glycerol-3-phosphate 1-O-acyltransferase PlsY [Clostridia bacterium]|nr:glycerol-3-phosphate 1-O-acyltransferase PlsY [Clostridia bacterium]
MLNFALTAQEGEQTIKYVWGLVGEWIRNTSPGETAILWVIFGAVLLCIAVPYLLGSINPAVLISKLVYREDIRNFGSGNAGTTNMLRTYGKKAAAATFLLDLGKAALAVLFGLLIFGTEGRAIAGFFVIFGHMFPIFAKFHGGKGVACLAMVVLLTSWQTFLILLGIFLIIAIGTRYISMGSIMCAMLYPLIMRAFAPDGLNVAMAVLSAVAVVFMHRENIKRIMAGKESKVSFSKISKKKKEESEASSDGEQT